jgi:hypothetical protein
MTPDEAAAVFAVFEHEDGYDSLMWRVTSSPGTPLDMRLWALCNDVFEWAAADGEEITVADMPLLRQCAADLAAAGASGNGWIAALFAARKRRLCPQEPFFKYMPAAVAALFDTCGASGGRRQ